MKIGSRPSRRSGSASIDELRANPEAARADYDEGVKAGDLSRAHVTVGEAVGLIRDVPAAGEMIGRMTFEAQAALGRACG